VQDRPGHYVVINAITVLAAHADGLLRVVIGMILLGPRPSAVAPQVTPLAQAF
jgi:hypothetical protein